MNETTTEAAMKYTDEKPTDWEDWHALYRRYYATWSGCVRYATMDQLRRWHELGCDPYEAARWSANGDPGVIGPIPVASELPPAVDVPGLTDLTDCG